MKISVAMATFNGEKYLAEQLESICKQTLPPYELVICDDGSTDCTVEIIENYSRHASFPVRLFLNENNLGYSDNFLKCASLCEGDWIAFSDQDDVWLPIKLEKVALVIQSHPGDELVLVGHTSNMADSNLQLVGQKLPDFKKDDYIERCNHFGFYCIVGFSMVFKSLLIRDIDASLRPRVYRQNPKYPPGHDQWIGMLANALGDMALISEPLAIWRRHDLSLTTPPTGSEGLLGKTLIAMSALDPTPYVLLADMAQESAESFERISAQTGLPEIKNRARIASQRFNQLALNFRERAELYKGHGRLEKLKIFARMSLMGAYRGSKFTSLGWKAQSKDMFVALGLIGR